MLTTSLGCCVWLHHDSFETGNEVMVVSEREPEVLCRETAEVALASGDHLRICRALVSIALNEQDWRWVQSVCLGFLLDETVDVGVRRLSATCLGHVARIHQQLEDKERVETILKSFLSHAVIGGSAQDALGDIEAFVG